MTAPARSTATVADTGAGGGGGFPDALFTITGSPGSIEAAATRYGDFAATAKAAGPALGSRTVPSWTGSDAELYRTRLAEYPPMLDTAGTVFADIAIALNMFAHTMSTQQTAMTTLRAHAETVWAQLLAAQAALAGAQSSLGQANTMASAAVTEVEVGRATAQVTAAQTAVTTASGNLGRLQAEWEDCCRRAQAIHAAMDEAAHTASTRVAATESPKAAPRPSAGGAVAAAMPGAITSPLQALPLDLPTAPAGGTTSNPAVDVATALQTWLKHPLFANSVYSVWGSPADLINLAIAHQGRLPSWMRGVIPNHKLPTVNTVADAAKAWAGNAQTDLIRAMRAYVKRTNRIDELTALTQEHPLRLWNDVKLLGTKMALPFDTFDMRTSAVVRDVSKNVSRLTGFTRGAARILGPVDSFITLVKPNEGPLKRTDQMMAGANLLGTAAVESAPLLARAAPLVEGALPWATRGAVFIPGVGQVVAGVTGTYLAGKWLYDNYDPAKQMFNAVGSFTKDGGSAILHGDWDKLGSEAHHLGDRVMEQGRQVAKDIGNLEDKAADVAHKAWDGITSIF